MSKPKPKLFCFGFLTFLLFSASNIIEVKNMKRICLIMLAIALLGGAAFAEGYNSFMDDSDNLGIFDQFAWDGLYAYWLHTPDDGSWAEPCANLYRMIPGGMEAELLLEGREDLYIYDMLNIGEKLLLAVADSQNGQTHPALINFDGSGYKALPGNIGGTVLGDGVIYNSADGGIYEIPLDSMKPKCIYKYPKNVLEDNPWLTQYTDGKLYFTTDTHDWYELDIQSGKAQKFLNIRGNGFVLDGMFYVSDFDLRDGTWKYDISTGNRVKISETIYDFKQGCGSLVRATGDNPDSWFQGTVFDFSKLTDDLEAVKAGTCDENHEFIIGNRFLRYDWKKNRVDWGGNLQG